MTRISREGAYFDLWHDAARSRALVRPENLTTVRYEPVLRRQLGSAHIDVLFETPDHSWIAGGLRLHADSLMTRERSPIVWPTRLATALGDERCAAIERCILPWLRALVRARPAVPEAIRRFAPSERFERARAAKLVGAIPLEEAVVLMAPFVYARRFARAADVLLDCAHAALGQALLAGVARSISTARADSADAAFARAWYGITTGAEQACQPDLIVTDGASGRRAATVIRCGPDPGDAASVAVPAPAPWDLLFSFDASDAPVVARLGVAAAEPRLRAPCPLPPAPVFGGSSGAIVLAVSAEAAAMRGADSDEVAVFARRLDAEGLAVRTTTRPTDAELAGAELVHIFGAPFEPHTLEFAELARARSIPFVFDIAPQPADTSAYLEDALAGICRSAIDDSDLERYLTAYEHDRLDRSTTGGGDAAENARREARFAELTPFAVAVFTLEEDVQHWRGRLPPPGAALVMPRGAFGQDEPQPAPIGHLVPRDPFALIAAPIAARSHALFVALAAERFGFPLVIAGEAYDTDYLETLRAYAPSAVVLAGAERASVSALYRSAAAYVDPAPRPRSCAGLLRAIGCGARPILARQSPLVRLTGSAAATFSLKSIDDCGRVIDAALAARDGTDAFEPTLAARRDPTAAFGEVMAGYARIAVRI
jgi:hypothetical protein